MFGRKLTILSDHKLLEQMVSPQTPTPTLAAQRLQRWAIMLSAFQYDLQHIPEVRNADVLSRLPLPKEAHKFESDEAICNISSKKLESRSVGDSVTNSCPSSSTFHYGWLVLQSEIYNTCVRGKPRTPTALAQTRRKSKHKVWTGATARWRRRRRSRRWRRVST